MLRSAPLCLALCATAAAVTAGSVNFGPLVPLVTGSGLQSDLDLAVDSAGASHIAYVRSDGDPEVFYLTDLGGEWSAPLRLTTSDAADIAVRIVVLGPGDVIVGYQHEGGDRDLIFQRVTNGVENGSDLSAGEDLSDLLLGLTAAGPDSWAALSLTAGPSVDELAVWEIDAAGTVTKSTVALALNVRFFAGAIASGPDGVLHVVVQMVSTAPGSITRLMYSNNRGGSFGPLAQVLSDARGGDVALHVDDNNTVYCVARSTSDTRVRFSLDGGELFNNLISFGATDLQAVSARPNGIDIFEVVEFENLLGLWRLTGTGLSPRVDVPTPGWRAADIEYFNGDHFAVTSGPLQFTRTGGVEPAGLGDVNLSGAVDAADIVALRNHLDGMRNLNAAGLLFADVDGDLQITDDDVSAIASLVIGSGR